MLVCSMVVPAALRVTRLKPERKSTVLGRIATEVGWKYGDIVAKLEDKRKARSAEYYQRKKALRKQYAAKVAAADMSAVTFAPHLPTVLAL